VAPRYRYGSRYYDPLVGESAHATFHLVARVLARLQRSRPPCSYQAGQSLNLRSPSQCHLGGEKSVGEAVAEHRQPADGLGLGRLVLKHVPVLGELAVFEAYDIGGDP
jgi:hypothetical protein